MSSKDRLERLGLGGTPAVDLPTALSAAEKAAQESARAAHQRWRQENPQAADEYDKRLQEAKARST